MYIGPIYILCFSHTVTIMICLQYIVCLAMYGIHTWFLFLPVICIVVHIHHIAVYVAYVAHVVLVYVQECVRVVYVE